MEFIVIWTAFCIVYAVIILPIVNIPSYSYFENYNNYQLFKGNVPIYYTKYKEIYSEDRYIYKLNGQYDSRCVYAYITNRDDKPEIVIDWMIISGKEYCKRKGNIG